MSRYLFTLVSTTVLGLSAVANANVNIAASSHHAIHGETGTIISSNDAAAQMQPASLAKLMTLYLLFEAIEEGLITPETELPVSEKAWRKGGSKMFVEVGSQVRVADLMRGIAVSSGNDACIVVAEYLAGTEEAFADRMTAKAQALGMTNTAFRNASGWPHPEQLTTATDMVILAQALWNNFPAYNEIFSEQTFTFSGIRQSNRNGLLDENQGVEGMKTGHVEDAGYHLVTTANRRGERIFAAVLGANSAKGRENASRQLLNYGFNQFKRDEVVAPGEILTVLPVKFGQTPEIAVTAADGLSVYANRADLNNIQRELELPAELQAPIAAGDILGRLHVTIAGETYSTNLTAREGSAIVPWWQRLFQ